MTRYYAFDTFTDPEQARALAASGARQYRQQRVLRWRLVLAGDYRVIGTCGYTRWNRLHHVAIIGYDLARPYWGRD